jgi:DNA (cytosine-5)-methyltransferase 1
MRLGELFSGPGGMAWGAHMAGLRHAWALDIDPGACATFRRNIPGATDQTVHSADIRAFDLRSLSPIDVLAFGFPCNDFSQVGERRGLSGEFGPLYTYGVKALRIHQPMAFVAENVSGLRSSNEGAAFERILRDLKRAGYRLQHQVYDASHYGVPQKRKRVLIVGIRKDLGLTFEPPAPITSDHPPTAGEALAGIAPDAPNHDFTRMSHHVVERLQHIAPGENAFTASLPERLQINTKTTISQIYRRLHPDQPAYTVTGSGGGGTHIYHWSEDRALTNRERARLQSFPDDFVFEGRRESVRKQIGMAVPPRLAEAVIHQLVKQITPQPSAR